MGTSLADASYTVKIAMEAATDTKGICWSGDTFSDPRNEDRVEVKSREASYHKVPAKRVKRLLAMSTFKVSCLCPLEASSTFSNRRRPMKADLLGGMIEGIRGFILETSSFEITL